MSEIIQESLLDIFHYYELYDRRKGPIRRMEFHTKSSSERVIGALTHDVEKGTLDYKNGHLKYDNKNIPFGKLKTSQEEWLKEGKFPNSFIIYNAKPENYSESLVYLEFNEDQGSAVLKINKNGEGFGDPERVKEAVSPFIKKVPEGDRILERLVKRICLRD